MPSFDKEYFSLGHLDLLSYQDTFIHRLDPRTKIVVTFVFVLTVVSFPKYEITGLIPFFLFPVLLFSLGDIPVRFILKKVLIVSPFAVCIGIFNPFLDTDTLHIVSGFPVSGGWVSFFSILIKFILTISAALLLVATTSFPGVCYGLQRLRIPEIFVSQLLFLYRYLFVLMEEAMKIIRARDLRSFDKRGRGIRSFINIIGVLFIRTIERSERIYQAMLSRGFSGRLETSRLYSIAIADLCFILFSLVLFYCLRKYDIIDILEQAMNGLL
jgi:cobalt/nickel transport system permease protein